MGARKESKLDNIKHISSGSVEMKEREAPVSQVEYKIDKHLLQQQQQQKKTQVAHAAFAQSPRKMQTCLFLVGTIESFHAEMTTLKRK